MRSTDAGGPYRDSITSMCNELQSPGLPLFMKCPNGRTEAGENRDRFVPLPSSNSPFHGQLYEFVGQLLGLAIRSKNLLNLNFPSIVWKPLVNDVITDADVTAIDALCYKQFDAIRQAEDQYPKPELFDDLMADVKFEVNASDGKVKPLLEGGQDMPLTWKNRKQFVELLRKYRLNEFSNQCASIRRGLATVVPQSLLSIFSWQELEVQVCGRGITSAEIDLLEKLTSYSGCSSSDAHIKFFWEIMRNRFTEEDRAKFIVFSWGRSRLPLVEADYTQRLAINSMSRSGSPDDWYPGGHTCFFSVDMPKYTNIETMYKKILWAIHNATEIDGDGGGSSSDNILQQAGADSDDEGTLF